MLGWVLTCLGACRDQVVTGQDGKEPVAEALRKASQPLANEGNLDAVLEQVGNARFVLLGEASHGTLEFYTWRAALTRRLIEEKGFTVIAVEGDWPDAYEVNQYVRGQGAPGRPRDVLQAFNRWPTWMWANETMADLTEWMRTYNDRQPGSRKASFYGLDVYSLWESLDRLEQQDTTDLETQRLVRQARACLGPYQGDEQAYAMATMRGTRCNTVLTQLLETIRTKPVAGMSPERQFDREQNALVAVNAERYYYTMVRDDAESWNIRDRHMLETVERLVRLQGPDAKFILWAHNTHVGDARYTDMAAARMVNLGQLVRETYGPQNTYILGFSTYEGEVIAGDRWDAPHDVKRVPQAQRGSWDEILHRAVAPSSFINLKSLRDSTALQQPRGQRAIGVVYQPSNERGNYVPTILPQRYDGLIFLDKTRALSPLPVKPTARKESGKAPVGEYALIND